MVFRCSAPSCDYSGENHNSLSRHQRHCKKWATEKSASLERCRVFLSSNTSRVPSSPTIEHNIGDSNDPSVLTEVEACSKPLPRVILRVNPPQYHDIPPIPPPNIPRRVLLIVRDSLTTVKNTFNLFREYLHRPSYDPDQLLGPEELAKVTSARHTAQDPSHPWYWPFSSAAAGHLMVWQQKASTLKSNRGINDLVWSHLTAPDFCAEELAWNNFSVENESKRLENTSSPDNSDLSTSATPLLSKFQSETVKISVPSGRKGEPPISLPIPGLHTRNLVSVIQEAFAHPLARFYHYTPHRLWHRIRDEAEPERVYGELYTSDAFITEHDKVQRVLLPPEEQGCTLERTVAALMFWSDSTSLANFGTAKLWPVYMMLGNLSKHFRAQPNSGACNHIAYIPSLPDHIQDVLRTLCHRWGSQHKAILTHCKRELMHAVWERLLDDNFIHAMKYGIVIMCADGVKRRVFPRIFTYSADYPEKALLATIQDGGLCPCPRCLARRDQLPNMGLWHDFLFRLSHTREYVRHQIVYARNAIYNTAYGINSTTVRTILDVSQVPTLNAFKERLGEHCRLQDMLVVDLMHEFELGVWRSLFLHLLRLLHVAEPQSQAIHDLNERFRLVPTFGTTIRRFTDNVAQTKKLAARDYEDMLQVAIPVFDGLFPEPLNSVVLTGLYRTAELHALLKLQLHTTSTLESLHTALKLFGQWMRKFSIDTARECYKARKPPSEQESPSVTTKPRFICTSETLNLATYKYHALGDYPDTIKKFGTTDSYSTQLGELAHRTAKRLYSLTQKQKNRTVESIAKLYRRHQHLHQEHLRHFGADASNIDIPAIAEEQNTHIQVPKSLNQPTLLHSFLSNHDPAKVNFAKKLRGHLLRRFLGHPFDGETNAGFSTEELQSVRIVDHKIYRSEELRVNYTTYDIRRASDLIRPNGNLCNVMTYSAESGSNSSQFWYAKVLGIFRLRVYTISGPAGDQPARWMNFLWVRWYGAEPGYRSGTKYARLPKVGFVPESDEDAFGFLDPASIIRGVHVIPCFADGRTTELLSTTRPTAARPVGETDDYVCFYINIFVDRDMYMRFRGGGIGHMQPGLTAKMADELENSGDTGIGNANDEAMDIIQHDPSQTDGSKIGFEDEEVVEAERCPDEYPAYSSDEEENDSDMDIGDGYASM